jgi:hypothetical protein
MSRQEILDEPGSHLPQLRQFLGGYFHQDWPLDRDGWEEVVDDFVAESPRSVVGEAVTELRDLLADGLSDEDAEVLLEGLGCNVNPSAFNLGAAEWLHALEARLSR